MKKYHNYTIICDDDLDGVITYGNYFINTGEKLISGQLHTYGIHMKESDSFCAELILWE